MKPEKPISFLDFGQCLNCQSYSLVLIQREVGATIINVDGSLGPHHNDYYDSKLYCMNCHSEFNYIKMGFKYKPVSDQVYEQMRKDIINGKTEFKLDIKNPFSKE